MKRYKTPKKSGRKDQDRGNLHSPVKPTWGKLHTPVQWAQRRLSQQSAPDEPTMGKMMASVQWTQKLRLGFGVGWTDDAWRQASVQLSRDSIFWGFLGLHTPVKPTVIFKSVGAIDQVAVGAVTSSYWEKAFTGWTGDDKNWASDQPALRNFVSLFPTASLRGWAIYMPPHASFVSAGD